MTERSDGKYTVSAEVATVKALPEQHIPAGAELLLDYGDEFWTLEDSAEYCAVCFSKVACGNGNTFVQCDGVRADGSECPLSRHRCCFAAADMPSLADLREGSGVRFFCPDHFSQSAAAAGTPVRVKKPKQPPIQIEFTPPPPLVPEVRAAAAAVRPPAAGKQDKQTGAGSSKPSAMALPPAGPRNCVMEFSPPPEFNLRVAPFTSSSAARSINFEPQRSAAAAAASKSSFSRRSSTSRVDYPVQVDHESSSENESDGFQVSSSSSPEDESMSDVSWHSDSEDEDAERQQQDKRSEASRANARVAIVPASEGARPSRNSPDLEIDEPAPAHSPLTVRSLGQGAALPDYKKSVQEFGDEHVRLLQEIANRYSQRTVKPWFIPGRRKNDAVVAADPTVAPAQVLHVGSGRASVGGTSSGRSGSSASASVASRSLSSGGSKGGERVTTTNRWRACGAELRHDWAEYRSCCGFLPEGKLPALAKQKHSSRNVVNMFEARLSFFDQVTSRAAFAKQVARILETAVENHVSWMGGTVCCSCLRAIIGMGRGWMFAVRYAPDSDALAQDSTITASGRLRKPRSAPKRVRVIRLLRQYSQIHGHFLPNEKGKDLNKRRYFLSVKQLQELAHALSAFEQAQLGTSHAAPVALHQLKAARTFLEEKEKIFLKLGTTISLMRCATCDLLDNKVKQDYIATYKRSPKEVNDDRLKKRKHLETMQKQRDHFMQKKQEAMDHPLRLWTITIDGMDQSKTQLPHRARFSKDLDSLQRMKVHAEGGFCFGGPRPIVGLLNFPDLRKDSNLCIGTVERILDIQWQELENDSQLKVNAAAAAAEARAAAALQDAALDQEMKDEAAAADSVHPGAGYPAHGPGQRWPECLHLTFDNAAGECKNQWMFRFLGLLVLHGVFKYITVSTLLVGHTHDIVDQLFSIWARVLRIHNAETYEKLRALFRERYISRIQGLVDLMKKRAEARPVMTEDELAFFQEQQEGSSAYEWQSEAGAIMENFTKFVKETFCDNELSPHIELQEVGIDAQGWLKRCTTDRKTLPELPNLAAAHMFGIEKDKDGVVWLYNKFLCDSTEVSAYNVEHHFLNQPTGRWSVRARLWDADTKQEADPFRIPPLAVDTKKLRLTANKFLQHAAMTVTLPEKEEFDKMLDRLDAAQVKQAEICSVCAELCTAYCGHGVIHRPKRADEQEQQAARKKSTSKDKAWKILMQHLYDPQYEAVHHAKQTHWNWWTKWLRRAREHIQPAYVARSIVDDPILLQAPYHDHPRHLVTNEGELPCMAEPQRIDLSWLSKNGIPRVNQMAVVRGGDDPKEPYYIALITEVRPLTPSATAELALVAAEDAAHGAQLATTAAKEAAAADAQSVAAAPLPE